MRHSELQDTIRSEPFHPFRIHLSNGNTYDVRHPELANLTRTSVYVGISSSDDQIADQMIQCDLVHVVAIEPINGVRPQL